MQMTNMKENGLEQLIVDYLVAQNGYEQGTNNDYNKEYAIDEVRLFHFLKDTQEDDLRELHLLDDAASKEKFLKELRQQLGSKVKGEGGVVKLLRNGIRYLHKTLTLYNSLPTKENEKAVEAYKRNIFSVTRQVRYSQQYPNLALDFVVFINGLPIATFELKNNITKQNVADAVHQYRTDRDPKELIFNFKRCLVHFAVDDDQVMMCTELKGKDSWFLPFNKGNKDGAGNPVNPYGLKTDYLWKNILQKEMLSKILENYAQVVVEKDEKTHKVIGESQVFPRYHQLQVVEALLKDTYINDIGRRYLIQHSAGSGKSNSIAWLAYQLVTLQWGTTPMFDSIIVVTDRVNLDKQIRNTIRQFMQEKSTVGWADKSENLRKMIIGGKKIIISTIHKFPEVLKLIGTDCKDKHFAIIIDEAHSSQNGSLSAKMNIVLSGNISDDDEDVEDKVNKLIEGRKMLKNANYYAFTATPKNKTLEMFGTPYQRADGKIGHLPFHNYSMKQAIEEGFIVDVLKYYTPISSYYQLAKKIEDDPEFDKKRSDKKLRAFVEGNKYTIQKKAEIMVNHFFNQVVSKGKMGGKARAMVVTASIIRAIEYYQIITKLLEQRKSQYKALVAFSGEKEYEGKKMKESNFNGFPSSEIEERFKQEPYRILVVANKFQTGYDEKFLHTMYVDKVLTDIKAVQTLSRLNRAHPLKHDTFVLDFANDVEDIRAAFQRYYKTTILSSETDPNKLNTLIQQMEKHQVYSWEDVETVVTKVINGVERAEIDPILDTCAEYYKTDLGEDAQVEFKGSAKAFVRTYTFLAAILPFGSHEWEKLSQFLTLLIPKLPTPQEEDLSEGILENVDYDSYKNIIKSEQSISLEDTDAEVDAVPVGQGGSVGEPEIMKLSDIIKEFNVRFGNIAWTDKDKVSQIITELPAEVAKNETYQNAMKHSDAATARIESDAALAKVILNYMKSNMELFKNFQDDPSFKLWLQDYVFQSTYAGSSGK